MKTLITTLCLIVGLAGILAASSGCSCWTDETKRNTPGCIVAHDLVDCTVGAVKDYGPAFATIVASIISSGTPADQIPWDKIAQQAEAMGIKDGACFLAELKNMLFGTQGINVDMMVKRKAISDSLDGYKLKHFGKSSVKIKIIDKATGKAVEL